MPVIGPAAPAVSFRLNGKLYSLDRCICLYRGTDPAAMTATYLALTPERRFAFLSRVIGGGAILSAEEWEADRAKRFLADHGEGDIVEEFPDAFRKRSSAPKAAPRAKAAPRDLPAEPDLFPLRY